jgi:hypothetical protein
MTTFDPADTLGGAIPSLPPAPRDTGSELTVLDPRFPIRVKEPATIFWQQISEWPDRETVISQTIRATQQHTTVEERFVQPLHITAPIPAIPAALPPPPIYPELGPVALAGAWDTGPGTAILTAPEAPRRHRRHDRRDGDSGRFISRETS